MKAFHRIVTAVALAAAAAVPAPASANHFMTVCDSGDSGIPVLATPPVGVLGGQATVVVGTGEIYAKIDGGALGDTLIGVDVGLDRGAVCVRTPYTGNRHTGYDLFVPGPHSGWFGALGAFPVCNWSGEPAHTGSDPNCAGLAWTGILVSDTLTDYCVYLNGNFLFGIGNCPPAP